jgi:hypothetical protein
MPSTVIRSIAYRPETLELDVLFTTGRRYLFHDVPPAAPRLSSRRGSRDATSTAVSAAAIASPRQLRKSDRRLLDFGSEA